MDDAELLPIVNHHTLQTTFHGLVHPISSPEAPIYQFRGIKYASVPARFRKSKLYTSYPIVTDATKFGPICPQIKGPKTIEETMLCLADAEIPKQVLKQNEFECLNLNIACPAGLGPQSRLPVMVWFHGGGDRGSGSHWLYDPGALVRKSMLLDTPVIVVTFNFRIGLFGFAAGPMLREDNKIMGDEGVGNYGLRDQREALEWIHHFIGDFGGDPLNVTLFGHSTGAADIVSHLLSEANERRPLFQRAIVQSAILEPTLPDISTAGAYLSRLMCALHVTNIDQLRCIEAEKLVAFGQTIRAIDDGVFFRPNWKQQFTPTNHHNARHQTDSKPRTSRSRPRTARSTSRATIRCVGGPATPVHHPPHLQPIIIGDCTADSLIWSLPVSHWTSPAVTRRLKAICQSLSKASHLLHAYDISSYTPDDEITDHILDLVNDARIAWPTECIAQNSKLERGGRCVWRYVFDQEGPTRGIPHHISDLVYLFDNAPLPEHTRSSMSDEERAVSGGCTADGRFYDWSDSDDEVLSDEDWAVPSVDEWSYARVRDAIQERWIAFANGTVPWNEDKVFVFGPEGETGERSDWIFEGRRRRHVWKEALEPLGMQIVQKVGVELSRGPPLR